MQHQAGMGRLGSVNADPWLLFGMAVVPRGLMWDEEWAFFRALRN